jgi:hypothetical protein
MEQWNNGQNPITSVSELGVLGTVLAISPLNIFNYMGE